MVSVLAEILHLLCSSCRNQCQHIPVSSKRVIVCGNGFVSHRQVRDYDATRSRDLIRLRVLCRMGQGRALYIECSCRDDARHLAYRRASLKDHSHAFSDVLHHSSRIISCICGINWSDIEGRRLILEVSYYLHLRSCDVRDIRIEAIIFRVSSCRRHASQSKGHISCHSLIAQDSGSSRNIYLGFWKWKDICRRFV